MERYSFGEFGEMPRLETERLILRKLTMKDAADIFDYGQDPQVARHVLWDAYRNLGEAKGYVRYMMRKYRYYEPSSWGIYDKATGHIVGTIGYMWYQRENSAVEVGYSLARRCWNRGYMTEALQCVLKYTFETLGIHRVEAQHETDNPASGRVMEKCGMRQEGVLRGRLYNKGKYVDVALYSILKNEYAALRK